VRFSLGCELSYEVLQPSTLILNVEVMRSEALQIASEAFEISPFVQAEPHVASDSGNCYRRLLLPQGNYSIRYSADVQFLATQEDPAVVNEIPVTQVPLEVLPFLNPSRYCQSDELARFTNREFGHIAPGYNRVTMICNWIYEHVDYVSQSSDSGTSAKDTFAQRSGVCRDFAHLGITFCRALGIPARFVSAYAWQLEPPDFHAVFEAFIGGRWYLFDATRRAALDGLVRIGQGRDAADTAFAMIYGTVNPQAMRVWIDRTDPHDETAGWTTQAVSIASV
jgi:transglutaminase-like putative cysteine protease